jgi:hypothetical protein
MRTGDSQEKSKQFFFEKKNQKTVITCERRPDGQIEPAAGRK